MLSPDLIFIDDVITMPLLTLPIRSTVVRTSSGSVVLSPTKNIGDHKREINQLGPVATIAAPSLFHHLYLREAMKLYPNAQVLGANGLQEKRANLAFSGTVVAGMVKHAAELAVVELRGMPKVAECVFFHRSSKTLIVSDLCFNMTDQIGLGPRLILSLFGTYRRFAVSRFFLKFVRDWDQFLVSLNEVFALDFQNIVPAHGQIVVGGGKDLLRQGFLERGISVC